MNAADALSTIAEVAMALTGFTGALSVFRRQQHWTRIELTALSHLLVLGIAASVFSLLPMPLLATALARSTIWQLCLPALGICIIAFVVWGQRTRVRHRLRPRWPLAYWLLQSIGLLLALMLITAAFTPILRLPAVYLGGLLWMVFFGMLQFMVQVLNSLPLSKDD